MAGGWSAFIAARISVAASLSDAPGARLYEIVLATNRPWWLTAKGVWPGSKWLKAASGTMVSRAVLTAEPAEVPPLPVLAKALVWALRASLPSAFRSR